MEYSTLLPNYLSVGTYLSVDIKVGIDIITITFQQAKGLLSYTEFTTQNKERSD